LGPPGRFERRLLELTFSALSKEQFETLARAAGFRISALYGDYDYSELVPDSSRYMIWELRR
jgi:hypothetical protein